MENPRPKIVTATEWQQARDELLTAEKEATRTLDTLATRRRHLPMTPFNTHYTFDTPQGPQTLHDLFHNRQQLLIYQFMDNGPDHYCPGCTWFTNNIPTTAPTLLADHGITWTTVSDMPLTQIEKYKAHNDWTLPFVSSHGTTFSHDTGAGTGFLLTLFLRHNNNIYRTYTTTARGIEKLAFTTNILDLTPYGRQEDWENSPPNWPQNPTYHNPIPMQLHNTATGYGTYR